VLLSASDGAFNPLHDCPRPTLLYIMIVHYSLPLDPPPFCLLFPVLAPSRTGKTRGNHFPSDPSIHRTLQLLSSNCASLVRPLPSLDFPLFVPQKASGSTLRHVQGSKYSAFPHAGLSSSRWFKVCCLTNGCCFFLFVPTHPSLTTSLSVVPAIALM